MSGILCQKMMMCGRWEQREVLPPGLQKWAGRAANLDHISNTHAHHRVWRYAVWSEQKCYEKN
jgi:hypothetical protein